MITVPATEFSKNFGRYRELVQREPVAVTSHERVTGYFVSSSEYEEYVRVKSMMPKAMRWKNCQRRPFRPSPPVKWMRATTISTACSTNKLSWHFPLPNPAW